jgi:hypothetical protein
MLSVPVVRHLTIMLIELTAILSRQGSGNEKCCSKTEYVMCLHRKRTSWIHPIRIALNAPIQAARMARIR